MKKLLLFGIVLLLSGTNLFAGIIVNSSTEVSLNVSVSFPDVQFSEREYTDGNTYSTLIVASAGQLATGKPDVPGFAKWILIPNGTNVSISTFKGEPIVYEDINLPPVQPPQIDSKGASEPPFTKDETVFSTDANYPGVFAETDPIKHKRGQACTILWIYPYQYNPVQKRLTVYPDLQVSVNFTGIVKPIPSNLRNENLERNLKGMAINAEAVLSAEKQAENQWKDNKERTEGCELLIITHPDFEDAANTLAAWKIRRGIYTIVVNTTTTGSTTNLIENYIDDAYDDWDPAPSYLLFIGDADYVATWHSNWHPDHGDPWYQGHTATDIFYADHDVPPDHVPEFGYGRLSVDTAAQADSLVARIIRYERSPTGNSSYYTNTTMACCFQDGYHAGGNPGYDVLPDSIADRRFAKTSEDVKNYFNANTSYFVQRIYTTNNGCWGNTDEVFPTYWNDGYYVFENDTSGEEIPLYLQKPTFPWDGDTGDITTAFNNGRFFVLHRDHGSRDAWSDPAFSSDNVDVLTNGEKRPIVWSINCQTGWFDNETDDYECGTGNNDECFVEHWLRHSTGGSCGLIAATRISYSGKNDRLVWGWMDAIWPSFTTWCNDPYGGTSPIYKMGDVLNYGKEYMTTKYTFDEKVRTALEEFHWFGDPTTEMWTSEPNELTYAEVTSNINIGSTYITVQVSPAIQGMLVAICSENADNLFGTKLTNTSGIATVTLNHAITMEAELYITITKHDYLPYEFTAGWKTNTWTGAFNYYWHNDNNWTLGHIPLDIEDVIITTDGYHPPKVDYNDEECNNLTINSGATVNIYDQVLTVNGDMINNGTIGMLQDAAYLNIMDDAVWESGSSLNVTASSSYINVYGDWNFESGANVNPTQGFVDFKGTAATYIRCYDDNCSFYNIRFYRTVGLSELSTEDLVINGLTYINSAGAFSNYSDDDIWMRGYFNYSGPFDLTGTGSSTVYFDGASQEIHKYSTNDGVFNNVTFSSSTGTTITGGGLTAEGNIVINQGFFDPGTDPLYVGGNWTNYIGASGFVEGTGRVVFNGSSGHQYCSSETFNELEVDKSSGAFRMNGTNVVCAAYDWTAGAVDVLSGSFTANDLLDNAVQGGFYLNSGGTIDLTNSGTGTYVDLKGDLHIFGGTMTVSGSLSFWPYNEDASIEMSGGVLDFTSCGIYLSASHTLTDNITGGTIRTAYGFTGNRTDFNPTGGTIELYGSTDASLSMGEGSNFYDVTITKSSTDNGIGKMVKSPKGKRVIVDRYGSVIELTRSNTVNATSELDINGDLLIDAGTFNLNGNTVSVGDDVFNYGELTVDGTLEIGDDFLLYSGSTVDLSGTIQLGTYVGRHGSAIHYSGSTFNQTDGDYYVEGIHLYNGSQFNGTGGTTHVYVDGHVINNNIEIDDPDSYFRYFNVDTGADAALHNCSYDLEVTYTTNLYGPLDINSYTMNTIYSNVHSGGDLIIDSGGTVNVTGNGPYFQNGGTLTMESGSELNCGQHIRFYSGSTENVSGGEIFVARNFTDDNEIFSPTGGSFTFDGSSASLINGPTAFYNLNIDKTGATVTANSSFSMTNNLEITSGSLTLNGHTVDVANDVEVYGTLEMSSPDDSLFVKNIIWESGSSDLVTDGKIFVSGNWAFNNGTSAQLGTGNTVYFKGSDNSTILCDDLDSQFGNLIIDKPTSRGATYIHSSSTDTMRVAGDMTVNTGNTFHIWHQDLLIDGTLDIQDTALMDLISGSLTNNSDFYLYGELDVGSGDALIHGEFDLASTGELTIDGGSFISDAAYTGNGQYLWGTFNLSSGLFEIRYNPVRISSTCTDNITGGTIRVGYTFSAAYGGTFEPTGGIVEMSAGHSGGSIVCSNGNYFYNLIINDDTSLSTDLTINHDLEINAGTLSVNGHDIEIGGNWTNNVGTSGFIEGTGTVTFNGPNEADITTNETFYNIALDKTNPQFYALEIMDGVTINVTNNLNITDATIEMNSGSTLNIANDLNIALNAGLNAFGEPGLNIYVGGDWTNNNIIYDSWKGFYPGISTVTFNGSAEQIMDTDCANEDFYNLIIDKSGDYFMAAVNIHVLGDLTISNGIWDDYVGGLNHFMYGDVFVALTGKWYGSGSTVTFKGTADQTFEFLGTGSLTNVVVDKTATREKTSTIPGGEEAPIKIVDDQTRSQTVILNSNLLTQGGGTMLIEEGTLYLNGFYYRCTGDVTINDGGTLSIDDNAWLEVGSGDALNVNNGGTLELLGSAVNEAKLTHHSGYYDVDIESGGTISADYAIFEYISANGVNIKNGAIIDASHPFDNCSFRNGIGGGTLLTINNNQTLTIDSVMFPTNTWSGIYNVSKTLNQGNLTFTNAIGDFAGPNYENDAFDRIDWDGYGPDLAITNVVWTDTNPYVCDTINVEITIYNNGNVDIPSGTAFIIDLYYNLPSPPVPSQVGDQAEVVNTGIPAGDFIVVNFDVVYNVAESWNSYVQVDTDGHIAELNEGNNVWGPDAITWNGLPAIDDLTIQYNVGTNEIELNWTYPIPVDQYIIYRSTDPYDFTGADEFTSPTESYSETVTGTKYFYHVTAERTCTASDIIYKEKTERFSKR